MLKNIITVASTEELFHIPLDGTFTFNDTRAQCDYQQYHDILSIDIHKHCPSSFDTILCWPKTKRGEWAVLPCPAEISGIHYDSSQNATRFCDLDGMWNNYTNYAKCIHLTEASSVPEFEPVIELPVIVYYSGYTISLISLSLAIVVFNYFKDLQCLRNRIHASLFSTYILSALFWILTLSLQMSTGLNNTGCFILIILLHYFNLTNFFWMLVEGLYLYMMVVATFSGDSIKFINYVILGWGGPAVFILCWTIAKYFTSDIDRIEINEADQLDCPWMRETSVDWLFQAPACIVLVINLIFLLRIMWVLITKLRSANTVETKQYRKATKALIVLIPLFGITYLVVLWGPNEGVSSYIFVVLRAFLLSTQGFSVSLFYCFLNSEVRNAIKHRWDRWQEERSIALNRLESNKRYIKSSYIQAKDYSARSSKESIRPLTSSKRESCTSAITTASMLIAPQNQMARGSNGAINLYSTLPGQSTLTEV